MQRSGKRLLVWLLVAVLWSALLPAGVVVNAQGNLVQNGDFETGNGSGWSLHQSTTVSSVAAKEGGYGLFIKGNGGWGGLGNQTLYGLQVGKTYRLRLDYKALSGGVNIKLCAGTSDAGATYAYLYGTKTEWTEFAVEFEATQSTAFFTLVGSGTGQAEQMYLDNVSVTEVVLGSGDSDPDLKPIGDLMDRIKTQGRTTMVGGTLMLDFSISGIEFELDCAGDVYATFNARKIASTSATGGVYFTIVVDGVPQARNACRIQKVGETKVQLAQGLPAGKHTFAIYRQTEHSNGEVGVCALSYNGELLAKPADGAQYIEFIGDSISCGFGNLGNSSQGDGTALWSDGTQAYPFLTAKALNADWSNVSWSGLGCKYGYSSTTMQNVYPVQRYQYDKNTLYAFEKRPDVIVLALGTNDNAKAPGTTQKRQGLEEMLTLVRQKNPGTPIVWIYNMMTGDINGMIEDIVAEFGGAKAGYYACRLTRNTAGGGWHPNLAGQQQFAEELVDFLLDEGLCSVSGDSGLLSPDGTAQMELTNHLGGLAFRFNLAAKGVKMTSGYGFSLSRATVDAMGNGSGCKLVGMGALVTNEVSIGTDPDKMTRQNVSDTHVEVPAKYLLKAEGDTVAFAVRVVNIPDAFRASTIYARPYYVFEYEGQPVVVYGTITAASYSTAPLFGDVETEWS
ncbi:MAG: hypothetical protein E7527_04350 [Ruminococcaceae bacterium]|nr:hypothetical protein [Oscillospiraceae bacterium]